MDLDLGRVVVASLGMVTAWSMLCHVAAQIISNQVLTNECEPLAGARAFERNLEVLRWMGLAISVLCLAGFGLARVLDSIPFIGSSMLLQSLVLLAPATLITCATWSAEHHYGVRMKYTDGGLLGYVNAVVRGFRQGAVWLMVPVLILIAIADAVSRLPISSSAINVVLAAVVIFGITLGLPWMIRYLFKTRPMSPDDLTWTKDLLSSVGVTRTRIVCWDTGGRGFNAMVAGFIPPLRTLLVTDRLIDELPRDEMAMVILHEAAHLQRRHVPLRMISVLPAWLFAAMITKLCGDASWAITLGTLAGILMTTLILKSVAHRTEHDADWHACVLAEKAAKHVDAVPSTTARAAATLAQALARITADDPSATESTWLHPGLTQRMDFLYEKIQPTANNAVAATQTNPA
jgi:Zn-dependent protease with chaperone function